MYLEPSGVPLLFMCSLNKNEKRYSSKESGTGCEENMRVQLNILVHTKSMDYPVNPMEKKVLSRRVSLRHQGNIKVALHLGHHPACCGQQSAAGS